MALPPSLDIPSPNDKLLVPMTWIGPLYPGAPINVTLTGATAKSIYEQILDLKPEYTPWAFDDFRADMHAKGITREMFESTGAISPNPAARAAHVLKRKEGWFDCGAAQWARWVDCGEGLNYLYQLGGGNGECGVDGRGQPYTCTRFSCSWKCGMFLCSRVSFPNTFRASSSQRKIMMLT